MDIALGGLAFEESVVNRASDFEFPDNALRRTGSAEDLIVLKAFANRAKDWIDIEGFMIRQQVMLDWSYVFAQLRPLVELKEAPEILGELQK